MSEVERLMREVDLSCRDEEGLTPLHHASIEGQVGCVRALLKGSDVNAADNRGWTPLMNAARFGHVACLNLLIENGAELDRTNEHDDTALHVAAAHGELSSIIVLCKAGADPMAKNNIDRTPSLVAMELWKDNREAHDGDRSKLRIRAISTLEYLRWHGTVCSCVVSRPDSPVFLSLECSHAFPHTFDPLFVCFSCFGVCSATLP